MELISTMRERQADMGHKRYQPKPEQCPCGDLRSGDEHLCSRCEAIRSKGISLRTDPYSREGVIPERVVLAASNAFKHLLSGKSIDSALENAVNRYDIDPGIIWNTLTAGSGLIRKYRQESSVSAAPSIRSILNEGA